MPQFSYEHHVTGPFTLEFQNQYFNGWPTARSGPYRIVMAFPVEGTDSSVAVTVAQRDETTITGEVYGARTGGTAQKAWQQALCAISVDADGSGWVSVGDRDPVIAELQRTYQYLRPSLFHSPYEAAAAFIIGHRISIAQARSLRQRLSQRYGEESQVDGDSYYAFPGPRQVLEAKEFEGVNPVKSERLAAVARAALAGWLDRRHLRSLPESDALSLLATLPGIGPFFAQGILHRGAGTVDGMTIDDMTLAAISASYPNLADNLNPRGALELAERWRPYRMWSTVLLHVWMRQNNLVPKRGARTGGRGPRAGQAR